MSTSGGEGGGGAVIGDQADVGFGSSNVLAIDGAYHAVPWIVNVTPAWTDGAGNITEAGLYQLALQVVRQAAPTTPGLYVALSVDAAYEWQPLDPLGVAGATFVQSVAIGAADLPFAVSCAIDSAIADITGEVECAVTVSRLAYG